MSDFERRLHAMQRRDAGDHFAGDAGAVAATSTKMVLSSVDLGWQATERLTHLMDVRPGTSIKLIVDGLDEHSRFEVHWDESGVPSVQQF